MIAPPTVFEIIARGFARHVLRQGLSNDPVRDAAWALTMVHPLRKGTASRLTGWAIIRENGAICQSDIVAPGVASGDPRTRYQAFADELAAFREPAVFLEFTKATVNIGNVFATYDPRVTRICSPTGCETFDATATPGKTAGVAWRNIHKESRKRHGGG